MKPKRTEPPIRIRLKGAARTQVFHPGDTVSGVVEIQPDDVMTYNKIEIKVGWHTEGKGDRDGRLLHEIELPKGELNPQYPLVEPFDIVMPDSPWTFYGHYINIIWAIEVTIHINWLRKLNETLPFTVEPLPVDSTS